MRKFDDGDGLRDCNLADLMNEFQDDVLRMDEDIDETEYQLITNQYAYVKFGLILEKIRTRSWWKKCSEKFSDFRDFCQLKVNLNIWQVANAIKSARVAIQLAFLGFTELPRNASQALKMADLSIDRLGEVWGNVVSTCQGHKITALAIEQQINPDKQPTSDTLRIPAGLGDKIRREAIERGISVTEYLEGLINGEFADDNTTEPVTQSIDEEIADLLDCVEAVEIVAPVQVSIAPAKIVESIGNSIDRMREAMYDRYLPKWKQTRAYGSPN